MGIRLALWFRLRRREQREIAEIQDVIVSTIYSIMYPPPVLHGGTVFWRVYGSPRFSEDINAYHEAPSNYREKLKGELNAYQIKVTEFKETANAVYVTVERGRRVRLEFLKKRPKSDTTEAEYHLINGNFIVIKTLTPERLLQEKVQAYLERRKARDLFDIYYLLSYVDTRKVKTVLGKLATVLDQPPPDWSELRVLILTGLPPSYQTVKNKILKAMV